MNAAAISNVIIPTILSAFIILLDFSFSPPGIEVSDTTTPFRHRGRNEESIGFVMDSYFAIPIFWKSSE